MVHLVDIQRKIVPLQIFILVIDVGEVGRCKRLSTRIFVYFCLFLCCGCLGLAAGNIVDVSYC